MIMEDQQDYSPIRKHIDLSKQISNIGGVGNVSERSKKIVY